MKEVYWFNSLCTRVAETNTHILFQCNGNGYVWRVTKAQWESGKLTEVEG